MRVGSGAAVYPSRRHGSRTLYPLPDAAGPDVGRRSVRRIPSVVPGADCAVLGQLHGGTQRPQDDVSAPRRSTPPTAAPGAEDR